MEIKIYPDKILKKRSAPVELNDNSVIEIMEQMSLKMYEADGIGLAAPQVGILKRMVVIDIREPNQLLKMINPKITWFSDEIVESTEGCLSLPSLCDTIIRYRSVSVEYWNEKFEKCFIEKADGLLAICLQHELDHLDGKLYIDRLNPIDRALAIKEFKKIQHQINNQ